MSYTHLTISERIELHKLREIEPRSITEVAGIMNRSKSTISRELRRNRDEMIECYFANPYHSWERGLNEHTNGLL